MTRSPELGFGEVDTDSLTQGLLALIRPALDELGRGGEKAELKFPVSSGTEELEMVKRGDFSNFALIDAAIRQFGYFTSIEFKNGVVVIAVRHPSVEEITEMVRRTVADGGGSIRFLASPREMRTAISGDLSRIGERVAPYKKVAADVRAKVRVTLRGGIINVLLESPDGSSTGVSQAGSAEESALIGEINSLDLQKPENRMKFLSKMRVFARMALPRFAGMKPDDVDRFLREVFGKIRFATEIQRMFGEVIKIGEENYVIAVDDEGAVVLMRESYYDINGQCRVIGGRIRVLEQTSRELSALTLGGVEGYQLKRFLPAIGDPLTTAEEDAHKYLTGEILKKVQDNIRIIREESPIYKGMEGEMVDFTDEVSFRAHVMEMKGVNDKIIGCYREILSVFKGREAAERRI